MDLQAKIDEFKAKTKEIREANPDINQVNWEIKEIPFQHFSDYLEATNRKIENCDQLDSGQLFFFPIWGYESQGCQIMFMSQRVILKRVVKIVEVEEELS